MKNINQFNIWTPNGNATAKSLTVSIVFDDMSSRATFYYQINGEVSGADGAPPVDVMCASGNVDISGSDYENWGVTGDTNAEAYQYVAGKSNVTLL